ANGAQVWALHQFLIGLRRRHPWLHAASTTALRLDNRHYVYRTHHGDDALIVALNVDDTPLEVSVPRAQVIAGSGAPPDEVVDAVVVEPGGWRILRPS
ncbi:MAG: DUF3459 domain-containing protein, partial [Mycobacterium sp.]